MKTPGLRAVAAPLSCLGIHSLSSCGFVTQAKPPQPQLPHGRDAPSPSLRRVSTLPAGKERGKVEPFLICGNSIRCVQYSCARSLYLGILQKYQMCQVPPHHLNCILNASKAQRNEQQELGVECWLGKRRNGHRHFFVEFCASNLPSSLLKPRIAVGKLCHFIQPQSKHCPSARFDYATNYPLAPP